jgi:hypothetical protein
LHKETAMSAENDGDIHEPGQSRGDSTESDRTGPDCAEPDDAAEAFARLAAADPAAGLAVRQGVLRAKVDERIAALSTDAAVGTAANSSTADALADQRNVASRPANRGPARWRRPVLWVAAATVGAVAFGGGGYALGVGSAGASGSANIAAYVASAVGTPEAAGTTLAAGADAPASPAVGAAQTAPAAQATLPAAAGSARPAPPPDAAFGMGAGLGMGAGGGIGSPPTLYSGHSFFTGQGLSSQAGTANVYAYDATGIANLATATRIAGAFGVAGEAAFDGSGAWRVGSDDAGGGQILLLDDGSGSFSYWNNALDPWSSFQPVCDASGTCTSPPATSFDDAATTALFTNAMRNLGVDPAGYVITVSPNSGSDPSRWATAQRIVDGVVADTSWTLSASDAGIISMYGSLADIVSLGTYDLISPADAVSRLNDVRFAAAVPLSVAANVAAAVPEVAPTPPALGSRVPWPIARVTITGARLSLTSVWTGAGAQLLVPAYALTDDAGNTWSVIALTEGELAF